MARGNRREAIVLDDEDRDRFRKLLGDLVQQTGWKIFAWVLRRFMGTKLEAGSSHAEEDGETGPLH